MFNCLISNKQSKKLRQNKSSDFINKSKEEKIKSLNTTEEKDDAELIRWNF